ncbi:PilZ domain-containing protein [Pseudobutyrivibrio sp. YE44]|uniref:PilZ domain-containing protein n=1 Tax=Pseudobutyrivibrio sp. YE44 TaxID=1520802 RepID=UPI0015A4E960|nr:PilZ domain-containing protein [Pseudobutyrivibrio sp. YE44]
MRISEITSANKPYIRITKGKKKVDVPIVPKVVAVPPSKLGLRKFAFLGCDNIKVTFKGKTVRLNWAFNHNRMTLYCTGGHKAYSWNNVKVATINSSKGKREHLIVCRREFGDETERRRYKRYPIIRKIKVTQGDYSFMASTADISYGGVGISVKRNTRVIPSEPLVIDFGDSTIISARLVRTVFKEDGSELLGCHISKGYKFEMMKIVNHDEAVAESLKVKEKENKKDTDKGWTEGEIKRWH